MTADTLSFGKAFASIIKNKNLKKTEVGKLIGKSDPAVHRFINDISSPSIDTSLRALEPLGYTLAIVPSGSELPEDSFFLHTTSSKSKE